VVFVAFLEAFDLAVEPADLLHLRGGGGNGRADEVVFRRGRGHAAQSADLGVGQLAGRKVFLDLRQDFETARHADMLLRRSQADAAAPGEPLRARHAAVGVPTASAVELGDHREQPARGGVDVSGLSAQAVGQLGVGEVVEHRFDHRQGV